MIITQFFAEVCHKSDIPGRQPREAKVRLVKVWVSSQDFGVTVTPQTTTIEAAAMNAAG